MDQHRRRQDRIQAEPAQLEARDVRDAHLLWRRADWDLLGRLDVGAGAEVVVVASTSMYGEHTVYGLDARTGTTRWTLPAQSRSQSNDHRFLVRDDRVYLFGEGPDGGQLVVVAQSGKRAWQCPAGTELAFSPRGNVAVGQHYRSNGTTIAHVLDVARGTLGSAHSIDGVVRAISDAGIAYYGRFEEPGIAALNLADGRELWRVSSVLAYQVAVSSTAVYCAHLREPEYVGVVEALDAESGRRRWQWQTPGNLRALLRLWGARTPRMVASAGWRIGMSVGAALAQPSLRAIRSTLAKEIRQGQWRHPQALDAAVNDMWLVSGWGAVYLGTRLGVFALDAGDGHLLWHGLPTTDLSFITSALAPGSTG
jgi:outer membrane protein assembly factor BamB